MALIGLITILLIVLGCYEHKRQQNNIQEIDAYNRRYREQQKKSLKGF